MAKFKVKDIIHLFCLIDIELYHKGQPVDLGIELEKDHCIYDCVVCQIYLEENLINIDTR